MPARLQQARGHPFAHQNQTTEIVPASRAQRAWQLAGGLGGVRAEEGRTRDVELTRVAASMVAQAKALGQAVSVAMERVASVGRRRMAWSRGRVQRIIYHAQAGGLRPDGRQRWAIDQILEWQGTGDQTRAHIRWLGFDPDTGEPWKDSWVRKAWLTADLREADPGVQRRSKRKQGGEAAGPQEPREGAVPGRAQGPAAQRSRRGDSEDLVMISYVGRGMKRQGEGAMEERAIRARRLRVGGTSGFRGRLLDRRRVPQECCRVEPSGETCCVWRGPASAESTVSYIYSYTAVADVNAKLH